MQETPRMLFADDQGRIYDHPDYLMVGRSAGPDRPPNRIGPDRTARDEPVVLPAQMPPRRAGPRIPDGRLRSQGRNWGEGRPNAGPWPRFSNRGYVRTLLPAAEGRREGLRAAPVGVFGGGGFLDGKYVAGAFRVEDNPHWDPRNFDDRKMMPKTGRVAWRATGTIRSFSIWPTAATHNHCFAAKNLFLERWGSAFAGQQNMQRPLPRVPFRSAQRVLPGPRMRGSIFARPRRQIVDVAAPHLENAPDSIVSFGQGCEGEPLTEAPLIEEAIVEIRNRTKKGTVNLNTNGSLPPGGGKTRGRGGWIPIRVSLNSARPEIYRAYVRPNGFDITDIEQNASFVRRRGALHHGELSRLPRSDGRRGRMGRAQGPDRTHRPSLRAFQEPVHRSGRVP